MARPFLLHKFRASGKLEITRKGYVIPYLGHEASHYYTDTYSRMMMMICLKKTFFVRSLIPSAAHKILIAGRIITMNSYTAGEYVWSLN
jgi:hypothetical protein